MFIAMCRVFLLGRIALHARGESHQLLACIVEDQSSAEAIHFLEGQLGPSLSGTTRFQKMVHVNF